VIPPPPNCTPCHNGFIPGPPGNTGGFCRIVIGAFTPPGGSMIGTGIFTDIKECKAYFMKMGCATDVCDKLFPPKPIPKPVPAIPAATE
jgi:hypothetical protein